MTPSHRWHWINVHFHPPWPDRQQPLRQLLLTLAAMLACVSDLHALTLWCAAVSPPPSMHEQLKDFLPGSIILNCELIDCDKQLPHWPGSQHAEESVSPYPGAVTLALSNELRGWPGNSFRCSQDGTSKRSACRLKPEACGEFILSQLAFTPTTALLEAEGEATAARPLSYNSEVHRLSKPLKDHLLCISIVALKYHIHSRTSKSHTHPHTHTIRHMPLVEVMIHNIWYSKAS